MKSEHQPYIIGYCHKCGTAAVFCDDWDRLEWDDTEYDCIHSLNPETDKDRIRAVFPDELEF